MLIHVHCSQLLENYSVMPRFGVSVVEGKRTWVRSNVDNLSPEGAKVFESIDNAIKAKSEKRSAAAY